MDEYVMKQKIQMAFFEPRAPEALIQQVILRSRAVAMGVAAQKQLEDALLDILFEGVDPGKASQEEQANLREEFRGHIRGTEGYNKMILSGDGNISNVLNDPQKMNLVCGDIINGIMEKMNPDEKAPQNNAPQRNNEKQMNHGGNAPQIPEDPALKVPGNGGPQM